MRTLLTVLLGATLITRDRRIILLQLSIIADATKLLQSVGYSADCIFITSRKFRFKILTGSSDVATEFSWYGTPRSHTFW